MFSVTYFIDPVASAPPPASVPPAPDRGLVKASGSPRGETQEQKECRMGILVTSGIPEA